MYYIIWGRASDITSVSFDEEVHHSFIDSVRWKTDKYKSFRFIDEDVLYVYSIRDNSLEKVTGKLLNEAIDTLGYTIFVNINNKQLVSPHSINIQSDILGISFNADNQILYVAFEGYILKYTGIKKLHSLAITDVLSIGYVDAYLGGVRVIHMHGNAHPSLREGSYTGHAGIALCNHLL